MTGGLDLATSVIKRAAAQLKLEHPSLNHFSTLSPIPGFLKWLEDTTRNFETSSILLPRKHFEHLSKAYYSLPPHTEEPPYESIDQHILLKWLLKLMQNERPIWTMNQALVDLISGPLIYLTTLYVCTLMLLKL